MMAIIGFALAAFAAYWVYNDAKGRGHGDGAAAGWAIGTFLMLIVFLPLYLIFGRQHVRQRREEKAIDIEAVPVEEENCTMCGGKVKEEFKVCPYCGFTLRPKCENCGQELRRDWSSCPNCAETAKQK